MFLTGVLFSFLAVRGISVSPSDHCCPRSLLPARHSLLTESKIHRVWRNMASRNTYTTTQDGSTGLQYIPKHSVIHSSSKETHRPARSNRFRLNRLNPIRLGPIPVAEICFWPIGFDSTGASRIGPQRGADPSGRNLFFGRSDSIRLEPVGSAPKGGRIPVANICFLADRIRFDWSQSDRHSKGGGFQWPTFVFWPIGFDSTGASRIGTQRGADPSGRHLFFGRSDSIRLGEGQSGPF